VLLGDNRGMITHFSEFTSHWDFSRIPPTFEVLYYRVQIDNLIKY
jgi:hypothetical protein